MAIQLCGLAMLNDYRNSEIYLKALKSRTSDELYLVQSRKNMKGRIKMNKKYVIIIILTVAASCCAASWQTRPTVVFVLDTSPTRHRTSIRKAGEGIFEALEEQWRVKLFSVRGTSVREHFDQVKDSPRASSDFKSTLGRISPDWFVNANLAVALDETIYPFMLENSGTDTRTAVFILSDGSISRSQSRAIVDLAWKWKIRHQWPVIITGTPERTTSELLVGANKGKLHWLSLRDARYTAGMRKLLEDIIPADDEPDAEEPSGICDDNLQKDETLESQPKKQVPDECDLPGDCETAEQNKEQPEQIRDTDIAAESVFDSLSQVCEPIIQDYIADCYKREPNRINKNSTSACGDLEIEDKLSSEIQLQEQQECKDNEEYGGDILIYRDPNDPHQHDPGSHYPAKSTRHIFSRGRLLATAAISTSLLLAIFASFALVSAKRWQQETRRTVIRGKGNSGKFKSVLIARTQGRKYQLGDIERFKSVYIGKDSRNSVAVKGKGICSRHLRILRKGKKLYVINLSEKPVRANSSEVLPGCRKALTVPANIYLTEQITVQLLVEQKKNKAAGETKDEPARIK